MRPKKIYISAKVLEQPTTKDGEPKAMRVKTFPSKGDVEFVDLSQVWHDAEEEPCAFDGEVAILYENGEIGFVTPGYTRVCTDENNPAVRWAYLKELMEGESR